MPQMHVACLKCMWHALSGLRKQGFVDGLNLAIQEQPPPGVIQNAVYNELLGGCCCSSLLCCFAPDCTIIWCLLKDPGSWSDSWLAKRSKRFSGRCPWHHDLHSSRFCLQLLLHHDGRVDHHQLKSDKIKSLGSTVSVRQLIAYVQRHCLALSICQAAEWGMRGLQSKCGCMLRRRINRGSEWISSRKQRRDWQEQEH
jgi:hypothetical protein